MQKNVLIIVAVAVVALLGIGGFLFLNKNNGVDTSITQGDEGSIIEDILSSGASMECNYDDPSHGTVTAYIKDGNARVNYAARDGETGSAIVKDGTVYFWNDEYAFKTTMPDEEEIEAIEDNAAGTMPAGESEDPAGLVQSIENYREYCTEKNIDDSHFVLPEGVEFVDLAAMTGGMVDDDGDGSMPGVQQGNAPTQEEIDRLMEQYGQQ